MLCTHHLISNCMPLKTKMEETTRLSFMCFPVAIEKISSSCHWGDFHSGKSYLFPISLKKEFYLKNLLQGDHCSGLHKIPSLGEMLSCVPSHLHSDSLCIPRKETFATKRHAGIDH